ncbi:dentin sialophosphoprotein-like protein [Wolffia australiana]
MYGAMGKPGRGGTSGGRGGKRSLPPPAPPGQLQRVGNSSSGGAGRLSLGSSGPSPARRGVGMNPSEGIAGCVPEEAFRMVSADPLDFAAIIRLTPELVEEIKRVEAQGSAARIKFDANSNNLSGNVIDVGGKEFKFTWSRELGVCDIYQEIQNGEDGNGLLSECGTAWRKLNVQRILDESLKNHVKMRSEEAERQLKSRKSIVLDPANPSVKNQAKTLAAAALEGNMRKMHWKKDQFKKRKVETVSGVIPSKPAFKSGTPAHVSSGIQPSTSPQQLPLEQSIVRVSVPSIGVANPPRVQAVLNDEQAPLSLNGENIKSEKEMQNRPAHVSVPRKPPSSKTTTNSQPSDLRCLLISLLMTNPKGMSLKALEKAIGETIPGAGKKIEGIIKSIATYKAPGRYLLKPGIDLDISKEPPSQNTSPDFELKGKPLSEERERVIDEVLMDLVESDNKKIDIENIDIEKNSPEMLAVDAKAPNEKEDGACSSSGSGSDSDSDSDSSDSGSDSQSRSKSKSQSPVGSASGSSSDSESGDSSSSKEGSDVDIDIMTSDDDKNKTIYKEDCQRNLPGRADEFLQRAYPSDSHDYLMSIDSLVEDERKLKDARIYSSDPGTSDRKLVVNEDTDFEKMGCVDRNAKDKKRGSDTRNSQERVGSGKRPWSSSHISSPRRQESRLQVKGQQRSVSHDVAINGNSFESRSDKHLQELNALDLDPRKLTQIVGNSVSRTKNVEITEIYGKPSEKKKLSVRPEKNAYSSSSKDELSKDIRDVIMDVNEKFSSGGETLLFPKFDTSTEKGVAPLRRELSELELGELHEPPILEAVKDSKPPKHSASSKGSKKGRALETKKESPYLSKCAGQPSQEILGKRMQESDLSTSSRLQQRQRLDGADTDPITIPQGSGSQHKKSSSRSLMQTDLKENGHLASKASTDVIHKVSNGLRNSSDQSKESFRGETTTNSALKVDFSSDEDDSYYAKYDKDEPVLMGPIKDYTQYKDYVQEYREKYGCYSSLHNHLEKYRGEFLKVGQNLESCKSTDKEAFRSISEQIMQMYRRCRKKHSRMRKIFVVLHDELKTLKQRIKDFAAEYEKN